MGDTNPTHEFPTLGVAGFSFADLHRPERLRVLHDLFLEELRAADPAALGLLSAWRSAGEGAAPNVVSDAVVQVAPHVGRFVARLFGVEEAVRATSQAILADDPIFVFKKEFAKKRVLKAGAGVAWGEDVSAARRVAELALGVAPSNVGDDEELRVAKATLWIAEIDDTARKVQKAGGGVWTEDLRARLSSLRGALAEDEIARAALGEALTSSDRSDALDASLVARICDAIEAALVARRADHDDPAHRWTSFHVPHKWNFDALVPLRRSRGALPEEFVGVAEHRRERLEPFALTDGRKDLRGVAAEVDYCIYCHDRDKDSCSKGLRDKQGNIKPNAIGVPLEGCPLCEKISEMHTLRKGGEVIGAFAAIAIDNPMAPGTGHRICNDCMKGCIYQTQEPVNIPEIETRVLSDLLALPWGYEIYSLLTRWNPLNVRRPFALPYNGRNVLVVGMGPAGYTLAHHLLNEGFGVIGVDGLKIEPLDDAMIGRGGETPRAIRDIAELKEPLESRVTLGFGGVSEYGITVRWDKSFLGMLYLNLARRSTFRAYGGVRFGGTITLEDAWRLGVDHVAIAVGAGKPSYIPLRNNLVRGIRKASDFLMGLQLTGAYKRDSLANLQVRLPAVVIGGGLTAIDTATELLAYYVVQVDKTLERYEDLLATEGEAKVRAGFDQEELGILDEALMHGRALREERARAASEGRVPAVQSLLDAWGGVSIVYRRTVKDSPAYRLNHEEVAKSLEEGVRYVELMAPLEAHLDEYGALDGVTFERQRVDGGKLVATGEHVRVPARTLCVAAGTSPNVTYEREYPGTFLLDKRGYFENHRVVFKDGALSLERTNDGTGFFTSYLHEGHTVSYYGDNHPKYAGSVVRAMASGKDGYAHVTALYADELAKQMERDQPGRDAKWRAFADSLDDQLLARVHSVSRLTETIVEVVVRAPLAARKFQPGQFYRLQNFERAARRVGRTPLLMEGLAMTGAWTDPERGLLSLIVLEMGSSSRLCAMLEKDEPVVVMGPTGAPTHIAPKETVLLAGGGLGNAVLFSIARAYKATGSRVIYFAGYRTGESVFKMDEIEASTDQVIWASDAGRTIEPRRPQDAHFRGNIVQAMVAYENGELGEKRFRLREVDRIIAIGSDKMMAAVKDARRGPLKKALKVEHSAIGSINSPMQCMMKEICAQCLQKHVDPVTGKEEVIYSCFNQDQELDRVDFNHLAARLRQNTVQEKLTQQWFEKLVREAELPKV